MPNSIQSTLKIAIYGVPRLLDYLPPSDRAIEQCVPGMRAIVEVGKRTQTGIIIETGTPDLQLDKIKPCISVPDSAPAIDSSLMQLLRFSSNYYLCDIGSAMHTMLPKGIRDAPYEDFAPIWQLNAKAIQGSALTTSQQRAIALFEQHQGRLTRGQLLAIHTHTRQRLLDNSIITPVFEMPSGAKFAPSCEPILLNREQKQAADTIANGIGFACTLLYGVTGSGKTQVYLELVRHVLAKGKQALILVPEIGLTPQTLARFSRHFGKHIAVLHSALSERQRCDTWLAIKNKEMPLIIGTRSSIFAPCPDLGVIIVDEEHDNSFKQQTGFRYNARDLAILRGQIAQCPIVLGSATPLLSTLHKVERKQFNLIRLTKRATNMPMPQVQLVDMCGAGAKEWLAPQSIEALHQTLAAKQQALVFLNRRGFAPVLACHNCGWQAMCSQCDSRMTLHQHPSALICHHCGYHKAVMTQCPECGSTHLHTLGSGTQHIASYLQRAFPSTTVLRIDRDSVSTKGKMATALDQIAANKPVILVGTQMLAKGHDFSHLGLVIVLEADNGLFSSDYRAPEVTLQLLIQVAGRAGRSESQGQVLIQTTQPKANYFRYLIDSDYDGVAELLLKERLAYHLPPYHFGVLLRAKNTNQSHLHTFIQHAERSLHTLGIGITHLRILGPAPPALGKVGGVWQEQILLFHPNRRTLHQLCKRWHTQLAAIRPACQWYFDVDPYQVL